MTNDMFQISRDDLDRAIKLLDAVFDYGCTFSQAKKNVYEANNNILTRTGIYAPTQTTA